MTKDEALKLALEALEEYHYGEARIILRQALEQPEQEPSYWLGYGLQAHTEKPFDDATPLYTTPPQRTWVGLTGQEKAWIASVSLDVHDAVHRTEAKLKERNT